MIDPSMSKDEMRVDGKADHTLSDELQFKEKVKAQGTIQDDQDYGNVLLDQKK